MRKRGRRATAASRHGAMACIAWPKCFRLHSSAAGAQHRTVLLARLGKNWQNHGIGLTPVTSAPRLGSPLPHLHRDRARPCHASTGTVRTPATPAPGLGATPPHLHQDLTTDEEWHGHCEVRSGPVHRLCAARPVMRARAPSPIGTRQCALTVVRVKAPIGPL